MGPMLDVLKVTAIPAFDDNYIWLIHSPRAKQQVLVVDPGDAGAVRNALQLNQLTLRGILLTHHHNDHTGGVLELQADHPVPTFAPLTETIPGQLRRVSAGQHVQFPELGLDFAVLEVPGHTAGHIAYTGHGAVFCGDTLFSAGCGRLFEGTAAQMAASLKKLADLPMETTVYCAHEYTLSNLRFALAIEPENLKIREHLQRCLALRSEAKATLPSSIGLELTINPFLRLDVDTVKQAVERHAGRKLDSETEVFAVLRDWKNHFRG
ncbi:MAG: hydroxyacylglutathione hydrolase [Steroidobacteraceae bacterium]